MPFLCHRHGHRGTEEVADLARVTERFRTKGSRAGWGQLAPCTRFASPGDAGALYWTVSPLLAGLLVALKVSPSSFHQLQALERAWASPGPAAGEWGPGDSR